MRKRESGNVTGIYSQTWPRFEFFEEDRSAWQDGEFAQRVPHLLVGWGAISRIAS